MRQLRKHALAILLIAIGAGTVSAVAAAHHRLFTAALPYVEADRLVTVPGARVTYASPNVSIDPWVVETGLFEAVGLHQAGSATIATDKGPRRVAAAAVGHDFFAVFREHAVWGRTLDRTDGTGIRHVVLGYEMGRHLIGTTPATPPVVRIDGLPFFVVGVMPERFAYPNDAQVWLPFEAGTEVQQGRGGASVVARLATGISIDDARQRIGATATRLYAPRPGFEPVRSFRDEVSRGALPLLRMLMRLCLLLLAVTCVNVWGLGVVASTTRRHQTAIRMAVGATRRQLLGEIATRGAAIAAGAAILGTVVAVFVWRTFEAVAARLAPSLDLGALDWRLGVYALGSALLAAAMLVAGEAAVAARLDVRSSTLMTAVRSKGASRSRRLIIASQISLAFILLSVAIASTEAVARASRVDAGLSRVDAVSVDLPIPRAHYATGEQVLGLASRIESRLAQRFGGASVGVADTGVGQDRYLVAPMALPETASGRRPGPDDGAVPIAVSAGYFDAAGIPLLAGRYLTTDDGPAARPNVVISAAAARRLGLTPEEAIGREIVHHFNNVTSTVVGVVGGVRLLGPHNEPPAVVYRPLGHMPRVFVLTAVTSGPGVTIPRVVEALHALDPNLAVVNARTVSEYMWPFLEIPRVVQQLASATALIAVLLAAIAVYGLLAYDVASRRREIAIRLALGERLRAAWWRYIRSAAVMAVGGVALGLVVHQLMWSVTESVSREVPRPSALAMTVAAAAMIVAALWAASRPASTAAAVDPASLLKGDN